jgi:hypothetical protein
MEYEYNILNERKWYNPDSYYGFNPVDNVVIAVQMRDSDALERSNYERIFKDLRALEEKYADEHPDEYRTLLELEERDNDVYELIYDFRASHWAVGWVETLIMSKHAPNEIQMQVVSILEALADYPVYDEGHHSELEWSETAEYWEMMSVSERLEIIKKFGGNIFAARHDYLSESADPSGMVYEYLRTP